MVQLLDRPSLKKILQIFDFKNGDLNRLLREAIEQNILPAPLVQRKGPFNHEYYPVEDIPLVGRHIGFLKQWPAPMSLAFFTTKGGVLKTTLTLNFARALALHGLKVVVVGLDMQGDITRALGHKGVIEDENLPLDQMIEASLQTSGLYDLFTGRAKLDDIIVPLSSHLHLIPETAELAALNDQLFNVNRREYWLLERVVKPLKQKYDCVLMDCSPNWNRLATNALVACDALLSPLECKINNFRNFQVFERFIGEFRQEMQLQFSQFFIPTLYSAQKKLSMDIRNWYQTNLTGCLRNGLRETTVSEEASALNLSIIEHAPNSPVAIEMKEILIEVMQMLIEKQAQRPGLCVDFLRQKSEPEQIRFTRLS
ncbi:MAG: ParA family protein [Bdellovibrio sp.]|nr:ParA family protein [Bdellovibrio sp.]